MDSNTNWFPFTPEEPHENIEQKRARWANEAHVDQVKLSLLQRLALRLTGSIEVGSETVAKGHPPIYLYLFSCPCGCVHKGYRQGFQEELRCPNENLFSSPI